MKTENMISERTKTESMKAVNKKILVSCFIIIAYLAMWYINYLSGCYSGRSQYIYGDNRIMPIYLLLAENIKTIAVGLVVFMIPYELIFEWVSNHVYDIMDIFIPFDLTRDRNVECRNKRITGSVVLMLAYAGIYVFAKKTVYYFLGWYYAMTCFFMTLVAVYLMMRIYDEINNSAKRYVLSFIVINTINSIICYYLTDKYITAVLVYLVGAVTWHIYEYLHEGEIQLSGVITSIAVGFVTFVSSLSLSGHFNKWKACIDPYYSKQNDSSVLMTYLRSCVPFDAHFSRLNDYVYFPFHEINQFLGGGVLFIHFALFIAVTFAAVWLVKMEKGESIRRATMFSSIYLWFVFIYLYTLLYNLGLVPKGNMVFMGIFFYAPGMALLFRSIFKGIEYKKKPSLIESIFDNFNKYLVFDEEDDDEYYEDEEYEDYRSKMISRILENQLKIFRSINDIEKRLEKLEKCEEIEEENKTAEGDENPEGEETAEGNENPEGEETPEGNETLKGKEGEEDV